MEEFPKILLDFDTEILGTQVIIYLRVDTYFGVFTYTRRTLSGCKVSKDLILPLGEQSVANKLVQKSINKKASVPRYGSSKLS